MKYAWSVNQIDCKPQENQFSDVAVSVHWQLTATEGTYTSYVVGAVNLDAYDGKNAFIEYKNLTKEIVLGWVQSKLGENEIVNLKDYLSGLIQNQKIPQIVTHSLPWVVAQTTISTDNDQAAQAAQGV
jgi:hypothetical protein